MKVVTFNIRCDYGQDGLNEFANRKKLILRKINQSKNCYDEVSTPMRCIAPMDVVSKAELRSENTH